MAEGLKIHVTQLPQGTKSQVSRAAVWIFSFFHSDVFGGMVCFRVAISRLIWQVADTRPGRSGSGDALFESLTNRHV